MPIFGINNNNIYADNTSQEFRISVNNVDAWRYNINNSTIRQIYRPILQINSTLAGDTNPGQNYLHTWTPQSYQGPASTVATANYFTAPQTGIYKANITALCRHNHHHWIMRNGSAPASFSHYVYQGTGNYMSIGASMIFSLNAGDTISFGGNRNDGNIWGGGWTIGSIERMG